MKTPWRAWYDFRNRNWWQVDLAQHALLIAAIGAVVYLVLRLQKFGIPLCGLLLLAGCGSTSNRETKTVENEKWIIPGLTFDTPFGPVAMQLIIVYHQREQVEVEQAKKVIDMPEVPAVIQAVAGGSSLGPLGIAGSILGLLTTTAVAWKAKTLGQARQVAERQRDELIDGVERAKDRLGSIADEKMTPAWSHLTAALEAEQNADTKAAVKARVG